MSTTATQRAARDATAPGELIRRSAFAAADPCNRAELLAAPIRWPRPSRLRARPQPHQGKLADGLAALGLDTVGRLLAHLPREHRAARTIATLAQGEQATLVVEVASIRSRSVRSRRIRGLVEAQVRDSTGSMRATFFNQPWLAERYRPGTRLLLEGRYESRGRFRVSAHAPAAGAPLASGACEDSSAVARYPAGEGLGSTQIGALIQDNRAALADVPERIPASIRVSEGLPGRADALAAVHFPDSPEEAEQGRRRLAFEELLALELGLLRRRAARQASVRARPLAEPGELVRGWLQRTLPFRPTPDQLAAMRDIDADLGRPFPMQRLLMGEVGSGKTLVALYAMLRAVEQGCQAVLMAPTETLAEQHFMTLQSLLPDALTAAELLTGSASARHREDVLARLASGQCGLVVGTHALIEPDVRFRALAVAVIDEQHRFGVRQRALLDAKGPSAPGTSAGILAPHMLHMSATPIPRTLALTAYGDLDVSELRGLPGGRHPVATHIAAGESQRARAYERLREELRAGRQAFVVCPLVEGSTSAGTPSGAQAGEQARAATAEYERLAGGELREFELVLMHGQMPARERQRAMRDFAQGRAQVLVATTVIEVGVDVPNASVMLIEDAERYGISQLHQLRGRIGRGPHPSLCLLFGPRGSARLRALEQHSDGFRLAQIDLELREEGDLAGVRQSGARPLRVASLPADQDLLERARDWAQRLLAEDPELRLPENALLALEPLHGEPEAELAPLPA